MITLEFAFQFDAAEVGTLIIVLDNTDQTLECVPDSGIASSHGIDPARTDRVVALEKVRKRCIDVECGCIDRETDKCTKD